MKTIFFSLLLSLPASAAETSMNQIMLESQAWQAQIKCNEKISKTISTDDKLFEAYKCFSQSLDIAAKDMDALKTK